MTSSTLLSVKSSAVLCVLLLQSHLVQAEQTLGGTTHLFQPKNCSREVYIRNGGLCSDTEGQRVRDKCAMIRQLARVAMNLPDSEDALDTNSVYNDFGCLSDLCFTEEQTDGLINEIQTEMLADLQVHPVSEETATAGESEEDDNMTQEKETRDARPPPRRFKRKTRVFDDRYPFKKWNKTIPYIIDGSIGELYGAYVKEGLRAWEEKTCIRFEELPYDTDYEGNHLLFMYTPLIGCFSFVGMATNIIPQPVYLSIPCFGLHIYISHEVGHALGLFHEHQRRDRDDYINIDLNKVVAGADQNFLKVPDEFINNRGIPYDMASAMHYRAGAFNHNDEIPITTNDPNYQQTIGQRVELTPTDIQAINDQYCSDECEEPLHRECQHRGYQDPLRCTQCRCPDGWGGRYCERVARSIGEMECGGDLEATQELQYMATPYYGQGGWYENGDSCSWLITAPEGSKISFRFTSTFSMYEFAGRCRHWAEVRHGEDLGITGPRFCGRENPQVELISETNQMLIIFKSPGETSDTQARLGMKFVYTLVSPVGCAADPCQFGGQCVDEDNGDVTCLCSYGHSGRYCEEDQPQSVDIGFLMDNSYRRNKDISAFSNLIIELINRLDYENGQTHVGVLQYSDRVTKIVDLERDTDLGQILRRIREATYMSPRSTSNLYSAMWQFQHDMLRRNEYDRVPEVAVIITDGTPDRDMRSLTLNSASDARNAGIGIIVVAVGERLNIDFYHDIAGVADRVIEIKYYDEILDNIIEILAVIQNFVQERESDIRQDYQTTRRTTAPTTTATTTTTTTTTTRPTTTQQKTTTRKPTTMTTQPTTTPTTTQEATTRTTEQPTTEPTTVPTTKATTLTSTTEEPPSSTGSTIIDALITTTVTVEAPPECAWEGTECSQDCGGCGTRFYTRVCEFNDGRLERGFQFEVPCNIQQCRCSVYTETFFPSYCEDPCCDGFVINGQYCQEP